METICCAIDKLFFLWFEGIILIGLYWGPYCGHVI